MKPLLLILGLVAVLQAATLSYGLVFDGGADKPSSDDLESGKWQPKYAAIDLLDEIMSPLRRSPNVSAASLTLKGGQSRSVSYDGGERGQAITFRVTQGSGALIHYECDAREKGDRCPQVVCLCTPNSRVDQDHFRDCDKIKPQKGKCAREEGEGKVVVYSPRGGIRITALGEKDLHIELR